MEKEYFDFEKFVVDLEDRQLEKKHGPQKPCAHDAQERIRELNRLYREHPLSRTYVGNK